MIKLLTAMVLRLFLLVVVYPRILFAVMKVDYDDSYVGDFTHLLVEFIVAYRDVRGLLQIPKGNEAHEDTKFNIV